MAAIIASLNNEIMLFGRLLTGLGLVIFGFGFAGDNDGQKVRGLQTAVAGVLTTLIPSVSLGSVNGMLNSISPWVIRLGNAVIVLGGVLFGLGFASDGDEQKVNGLRIAVIGGITTAFGNFM